ncbi:MAG: helix-turn-helix domain-containing protein [Bacteroidales bacterium]|nr:helix-turn-helix domain-containing protein [Bacteroidales bacterium]
MNFILIIGLVISLGFSTYFYAISLKQSNVDKYLGVVFFMIFLTFLYNYLWYNDFLKNHPDYLFLDIGIPFLLGPMIWFYVQSLTNQNKPKPAKFMHYVPVIIIYMSIFDLLILPADQKLEIVSQQARQAGLRFSILTIMQFLPVPIYLTAGIIRVKKYEKSLKNVFSSVQTINQKWLIILLFAFLIFWLIISIGLVILNFFILKKVLSYIVIITFIVFLLFVGIYGIHKNKSIKKSNEIIEKTKISNENSSKKTEKKYDFIDVYVAEKKPFLSADLTINDLAKSLKMPPHRLSKILNNQYNSNFFDYINLKRVEEFKEKINNNEHKKYSILSLAYESGFNSKSAFYRYFKKIEGITPGEFIKQK